MKTLFALLFFALTLGSAGATVGQHRPKGITKRAFSHGAEGSRGKNDKAHFRHEAVRPTIDLHPHSLEHFKTAKANHHYKFDKPRK